MPSTTKLTTIRNWATALAPIALAVTLVGNTKRFRNRFSKTNSPKPAASTTISEPVEELIIIASPTLTPDSESDTNDDVDSSASSVSSPDSPKSICSDLTDDSGSSYTSIDDSDSDSDTSYDDTKRPSFVTLGHYFSLSTADLPSLCGIKASESVAEVRSEALLPHGVRPGEVVSSLPTHMYIHMVPELTRRSSPSNKRTRAPPKITAQELDTISDYHVDQLSYAARLEAKLRSNELKSRAIAAAAVVKSNVYEDKVVERFVTRKSGLNQSWYAPEDEESVVADEWVKVVQMKMKKKVRFEVDEHVVVVDSDLDLDCFDEDSFAPTLSTSRLQADGLSALVALRALRGQQPV